MPFTGPGDSARYSVGFLAFNPPSHLYHLAPIAFELSRRDDIQSILYCSTEENKTLIEALSSRYPSNRCGVKLLQATPAHRFLRSMKKRLHPRVRNVIANNLALLQGHRALVMTDKHMLEFTSSRGPKCICAFHGVGDRSTAYTDRYRDFDYLLVAGRAKWARLSKAGIVNSGTGKIVGYPKFDPPLIGRPRESFFNNRSTTVVYAPHFSRGESSWHDWGTAVLDYFVDHPEFNLIFAPHVMLFAKRRRALADKYKSAENIHIDLGSPRSSDMTYMRAADIYLGDVSSQLYEFIGYKPRPCIFLDAFGQAWKNNDNFRMWRNGEVVDQIGKLGSALHASVDQFAAYREVQEEIVRETFSASTVSPGKRAATAIVDFLEGCT